MGDSINYLKLDFRTSKRSLLLTVPPLIFMAYMFLGKGMHQFGISYLFLIQILFVNTPFMVQGTENLQQFYGILPTKTSKMVLGRFIYLTLWSLIILIVQWILIIYLSNINEINDIDIIIMSLSEIIVLLILFIEYPISYKIGFENGKIVLNLMSIVPACMAIGLPEFLMNNNLLGEKVGRYSNFILNNKINMITSCIFILIIAEGISYLISCKICRKKEV